MRVRFKKALAGPDGTFQVGQEADLPLELASRWADAGAVELIAPRPVPLAEEASEPEEQVVEKAVVSEEPERAVTRPRKRRNPPKKAPKRKGA